MMQFIVENSRNFFAILHADEERERFKLCYIAVAARYFTLIMEPTEQLERPLRLDKCINSFTNSDCYILFRFNRVHLRRLCTALQISDTIILTNRSSMRGEEMFLRGLYELVSGENQHNICILFAREGSTQSRAFSYFITHIYESYSHLVNNNLAWWLRNGFFRSSANAIEEKMGVNGRNIAHFIDCNCLPTSVVGGGPAEAGANAARWDDTIQRAFYNGWKSVHGFKHQTVNNPYGFTIDMHGPTSLRRNDLAVLRMSDINQRMANLQAMEPIQYIIFGDSAYKLRSHIMSYIAAGDHIEGYQQWNLSAKRVRISIEWDYGQTATLFKYVQNKGKFKLLKWNEVARVYTVATLMRNFHTALYGCQTSQYFNLVIPDSFLECYIMQTDM